MFYFVYTSWSHLLFQLEFIKNCDTTCKISIGKVEKPLPSATFIWCFSGRHFAWIPIEFFKNSNLKSSWQQLWYMASISIVWIRNSLYGLTSIFSHWKKTCWSDPHSYLPYFFLHWPGDAYGVACKLGKVQIWVYLHKINCLIWTHL